MTKIMLVDDHALFRKGLRSLIETAPGLSVVAEATDVSGATEAYAQSKPDVVLLDMKLPDGDGLEALKLILSFDHRAKIVMLSAFDFEEQVIACMRAGARGYLSKNLDPDELFRSIETVRSGGVALGATHLTSLLSSNPSPGAPKEREHPLTAREYEVAALVAQGKTNREIAGVLLVSPLTVKAHLANILSKLGLRGRVELASWFVARSQLDEARANRGGL